MTVHTAQPQRAETGAAAPLSSARTHTARLPLRLSPELLAEVTAHATARGEDRSEFVRRALRQTLTSDRVADRARQVREAAARVPFFVEEEA